MDIKLDFDDVLLVQQISELSSRKEVDLKVKYKFKYSEQVWSGIPIIATNLATVGTINMAKTLKKYKMMTWLHKFHDWDVKENHENIISNNYIVPTIGLDRNALNKVMKFNPKFLNIDVAHGGMQKYIDFIKYVRDLYPSLTIIAGTVSTPETTLALINAGGSIIRLGVGSGGHCTTRDVGVGYPIFSNILETSKIAHNLGAHVICDGGIRKPGDAAKAFAAGADFISIGSMFAAHDENTDVNEIIEKDGVKCAPVYGMSSEYAMKKFYGKVDAHRTTEGKVSLIPMRGKISKTLRHLLGGIRSACTYTNSKNIKNLEGKEWIRVNNQRNTYYEQYRVGD